MKNIQISDDVFETIKRHFIKAGLPITATSEAIESTISLMGSSSGSSVCGLIARLLKEQETNGQSSKNALEVAEQLGLVGAFDGPEDLSTNPAHMKGFGR